VFLVFWMELCNFVAMTTKKTDKESAIKSILSDLKKGIDKKSILQKLANNYKNSTKTFYNYFEAAEIKHKEFLAIANPIIQAKEIEAMATVAASGILSKIERQRILTDIALGKILLVKYIVADGCIQERDIVPTWQDRKNAIAELNKMDGAYVSDIETNEDIKEIVIKRINGT